MAKTKVTGEYLKDSVVRFTAKAGENITKGNAVYISGISGELPVVSLADADDTAKMPAFGLAEATVSTNAEVEVTSFGTLADLDTSSYTLGDILYVGTTAGALTNDPAGLEATKLQNIGIVQRVHASNGSIKVGGAGRTNAVPNLDNGDIFIGNSDNKAVSSALSTEIESYLDGGTSTPTFASATVTGDLTVDTNRLYVDSTNDRVGIALSTPPHRFSVGSANDDGIALYDGTNDLATIFRENSNQARFSLLDTGTVKVRLSSKPSDVNYINNGGNVGIGTSSPSDLLQVGGDSNGIIRITGAGTGVDFGLTWASNQANIFSNTSEARLTFKTNGSEHMRISSSGNLLYNTTGTAGSDLSDGGILLRRDSNTYMQIASGTESDTTLLYFYKKSGTGIAGVGDIKAMGNDVAINSTDEGRLHIGGVGKYSWSDTLFGPQNDNARDLGSSGARWKDAHLSGNLYCGGQIELPINSSIWLGNTADSGNRLRLHGTNTGDAYIDWGEAGSLYFRSGQNTSANRMSLDSSGNLTLYGGALYVGGTAAANALDDYEEGTFTPSLSDGTNSVSIGTSYYTKIGNIVTVFMSAYNTNFSALSSSGHLRVTGLPFTANLPSQQGVGTNTTSGYQIVTELSGSTAFLYQNNGTVDYNAFTRANSLSNASTFSFRTIITYRTA